MLDSAAAWCCRRRSRKLAAKYPDRHIRERHWQHWRHLVLMGAWASSLCAVTYAVLAFWLLCAILPQVGLPHSPGSLRSMLPSMSVLALFPLGFILVSAFGFRLRQISRDGLPLT